MSYLLHDSVILMMQLLQRHFPPLLLLLEHLDLRLALAVQPVVYLL